MDSTVIAIVCVCTTVGLGIVLGVCWILENWNDEDDN